MSAQWKRPWKPFFDERSVEAGERPAGPGDALKLPGVFFDVCIVSGGGARAQISSGDAVDFSLSLISLGADSYI